MFDFSTKSVIVKKAPWYIKGKLRFAYHGLLLDTSRHYLPIEVIKHVLDSMSYAKLNVLHRHIIDEQSFPLEVPTYPKLWQGAYSRWEWYTVEDACDIVKLALRESGIYVRRVYVFVLISIFFIDRGKGYPELSPSSSCREPLDLLAFGIVSTFNVNTLLGVRSFATKASGILSLDHLDVPWGKVYSAEPLEGITDPSKQNLVLGGEACMWGETADPSNVLQTIWPRAAAAAESLWSKQEAIPTTNLNMIAPPRLHYFRCLLNSRGIQAAPVTNMMARSKPYGPNSCYDQLDTESTSLNHRLRDSKPSRPSHFSSSQVKSSSAGAMSPAKADPTKKADPKAQALKAAKAVKSGGGFKKKVKKIRTSVTFHRPRTLKKERNPKYPRISAPGRNKLDHYQILKYPLTTESAMKKIEDNNTLVFIVDIRADKKKIKDAVKKMYDIQTKKVNTLIRPDGTKKAYVRLTPDYDALDVANKIGII
ncbi:hypothetical protein MLD38_024170 [Melastoma candidum]|uniref:Uncharacterized protein n=1 Tax=Melastoma candidum TaxID=119954 RepID=A0ACB9NT59_9MYRT|nr:hypothetical protein MLD38_024170 [Melastoma candidum]